MSRIGKAPIPVPAGVDVKMSGRMLEVNGPKGSLSCELPGDFSRRGYRLEPAPPVSAINSSQESGNNDAIAVYCALDAQSGIASRCTILNNNHIQGSGGGFPQRKILPHRGGERNGRRKIVGQQVGI